MASGTGFGPIKSMLEFAAARRNARPMTLYWGCRSLRDLYMVDLPRTWVSLLPNFRYVPVLSEALPEDHWQGRAGLVHRAVMEDIPDLSGHEVYACGAPVMVDASRRDFVARCMLPDDAFFADSFLTAADIKGATP